MPKTKKKPVSALRVKRKQPRGVGRILSAQSARIIERRNAAFKMRRDGYTIDEIATVLGVCTLTITEDLRSVLSRMATETNTTADEHRTLEETKYDSLTKSFMPYARERLVEVEIQDPKNPKKKIKIQKVVPPDPTAANVVMTASVHKRKLLALDVPEVKRLEVSAIREYKGVDMDKV